MAIVLQSTRLSKKAYMRNMGRETISRLRHNFVIQKIWPTEVYPGYAEKNAKKKGVPGAWYSTGEGIKSFEFEVMSAEDGNETIRFQYNRYLRYVDIGVGAGTTAEDVDRGKKARYNKRYLRIWDRSRGRSHRPSIMMEMRHRQGALGMFLQNYYGREVEAQLYTAISGIGAINIEL